MKYLRIKKYICKLPETKLSVHSTKAMDAQDQPIGKNEKSAACAMKGLYPHSS